MRLAGVILAGVLALAATVAAVVPQLVLHHRRPVAPAVFRGSTTVWSVPLAGGAARRVLTLRGQWAFPEATPDGRALVLERPARARTERWLVPFAGRPRRLSADIGVFRQAVVWNGGYLALEHESRPATGWRIDLRVVRRDLHVVWSRRMPFPLGTASVDATGTRVALVRMGLLELVTPHGRRLLTHGVATYTPAVWTGDGRSVLYWTTSSNLVLRNVTTGAVHTLAHGSFSQLALSADGRRVYFVGLKDAVSIPK